MPFVARFVRRTLLRRTRRVRVRGNEVHGRSGRLRLRKGPRALALTRGLRPDAFPVAVIRKKNSRLVKKKQNYVYTRPKSYRRAQKRRAQALAIRIAQPQKTAKVSNSVRSSAFATPFTYGVRNYPFRTLNILRLCVQREIRGRVLHSLGMTGKKNNKTPTWTKQSHVWCPEIFPGPRFNPKNYVPKGSNA